MRRNASPRFVAPHTNGVVKRPLVDVVRLVGRREHLGLVDVVDAEALQHLRFGEVPDAALGHDGDRDRGLDALDHRGVAHARHPTVAPDVGRHPLERHDGGRARVFCDLRLLGVDDVHDDAAAKHLGEAPLDAGRTRCALVGHVVECTGGPRRALVRFARTRSTHLMGGFTTAAVDRSHLSDGWVGDRVAQTLGAGVVVRA